MKRIGCLNHASILPIVGANAYDHSKDDRRGFVHTSCEVYFHPTPGSLGDGWVVVQMRAPLCKGGSTKFSEDVVKWITAEKFLTLVLLTSIKDEEKLDVHIQGHSYTYTRVPESSPTTQQDKVNSALQERMGGMGWTVLEEKAGNELSGVSGPSGTGFARKMYQTCLSQNTSLWVLALYCNQGDNTGDAIGLASQLLRVLVPAEENPCWIVPRSWSFQFGPPPPEELYS
jgi:hypothetical protein